MGPSPRAILSVLLSATEIQPRNPLYLSLSNLAWHSRRIRRRRSVHRAGVEPMMDLILEGWVSGLIELTKLGWMLGAGQPCSQATLCGCFSPATTARETPAQTCASRR